MLREKCPNTEFFWSLFSCIRTEYGDLRRYLDIFHAVEETEKFLR